MTKEDVVGMTQNHVDEALIINQIRSRGMATPRSSNDIIWLQQVGVTSRLLLTMQELQPPPGVIIERPRSARRWVGYYYGRPYHRGYYW